MLQQAEVLADGIAVLDAAQDGFLPLCFEAQDVLRCLCQADAVLVGLHDFLYLCEQEVRACCDGAVGFFRTFALRQVGHHDGGVEPSLCHLGQIDEHFVRARAEHRDVLPAVVGEEHRCVAVAVQYDGVAVDVLCLCKGACFVREPAEDGHHRLVAPEDEAFGMPLHAEQCLVFRRFDCLDDAVGALCRDVQVRPRLVYGLVVEGVDGQCLCTEDFAEQAALFEADRVRCELPWHVLRVLEKSWWGGGEVDVLPYASAQRCCHQLYAATDAEHGYLPVEGFAEEEELCGVALRTDAAELRQGLFAQEERVDVAAAREDDAVETVEQVGEGLAVFVWRNDHGCSSGMEHRAVVAVGQFAALFAVVARDADQGVLTCHASSNVEGFVSA